MVVILLMVDLEVGKRDCRDGGRSPDGPFGGGHPFPGRDGPVIAFPGRGPGRPLNVLGVRGPMFTGRGPVRPPNDQGGRDQGGRGRGRPPFRQCGRGQGGRGP